MNKFSLSFFFFRKKILIDLHLKKKGSFLFFLNFFRSIFINISLSDTAFQNISKTIFFFKNFLKKNPKISYIFGDKRSTIKFFNFKIKISKNFLGYFFFKFFFFFLPLFKHNGLKVSYFLNFKNLNFNLSFSDFLILKKLLKMEIDFFEYFFKILFFFNFFNFRSVFFNLEFFFKSVLNWNIKIKEFF